MIRTIHSNSPFLTVTGGSTGSTYMTNYGSSLGVGNMRYNSNSNNIEVYDGVSWISMITSPVSVGLDHEAVSLLEWARKKRNEELELERLAQTSPAIKDLVDQVKEKQEQIKIVQTLLKEEVKV